MLKRVSITLIVLFLVVGGAIIATQQLLNPMNTDLSVVGQGKPALVLAYENYSPDSGAVLNRLNQVKGDYEDRMVFTVADLGTPQGQAFARRYNLINGVGLFLAADGQPVKVTTLAADAQALREQLEALLALAVPTH